MHESAPASVCVIVILVVLGLLLCAPATAADVRGSVVDAFSRKPLKHAEVVLRPAEAGRSALGVTTDDQGQFAFFELGAGKYTLSVTRNGYIPATVAYDKYARLSTPIAVEKDLTGVVVRLIPACVVSGKVHHADGEPAAAITVEAYREYYQRSRHGFDVVGRARTNDRGEYRMHGLPPGRYYFAAVVVPFNGSDDVEEHWGRDAYGRRVPPERTVTTFLPSTWKVTDATQFTLAAGEEVSSADIFLVKSRTSVIRVVARSGSTGEVARGAAASLLREDITGSGYLPSHTVIRPGGEGKFEIRGVTPGPYILSVRGSDGKSAVVAQRPITIGNESAVDVEVLLQGETEVPGVVFTAHRDQQRVPRGLRVVAEPRSGGLPIRTARVEQNGTFTLPLFPEQTYNLFLEGAQHNVYLQSATLNSTDVLTRGLTAASGTKLPVTVVVDDRGAYVQGETQPGAMVSLIPVDGKPQRYAEMAASEWGVFAFAGVAPGDYRVVAWYDEPPCDLWNPAARDECSRLGQRVSVTPASSHTLSVQP